MLRQICEDNVVQAHGVIGLFPACSDGDDINVFSEDKGELLSTLCGLRQQVSSSSRLLTLSSSTPSPKLC